jgi:DNA modification methylase
MSDDVLLVSADARRIPLADNSVQCVVTSPPYWGLRKYAGDQDLVWSAGNLPTGKNGEDYEQAVSGDYDIRMGPVIDSQTIGWSPTCRCRGQRGKTQPCVVLDPFAGSGTTGRVAIELNRRAVLLDLAYGRATAEDREKQRDYAALARTRISEVQRTNSLLTFLSRLKFVPLFRECVPWHTP